MGFVKQFKRNLKLVTMGDREEALRLMTGDAQLSAWKREWRDSGLPESGWLAGLVQESDREALELLMDGWATGKNGLSRAQVAGIIVQHAQVSDMPISAVREVIWNGERARLEVRLDELGAKIGGEALKQLARCLMANGLYDDSAVDLIRQILKSGNYENTFENIWPIVSLDWARRMLDYNAGAIADYSVREIGKLLSWNDALVWQMLLKTENSRRDGEGLIIFRAPKNEWRHGVRHKDWEMVEKSSGGVRKKQGAASIEVMFGNIRLSGAPLASELEKIHAAGQKEIFFMLIKQLSDGEPVDAVVRQLAKTSPRLVESLREWCNASVPGPRPRLAEIEERRGDWQRLLISLDRECGITDPSVRTRALPQTFGAGASKPGLSGSSALLKP